MSKIKISVIIPIYNVEEFIEDTLDCILNQTIIDDIEVLMINDGSNDSSKLIIEEYDKKYENFHAFTKKNEGQGIARNYGLEKAQGEYIHFMDSDDYIIPNAYELLYEHASRNDNDITVCDVLRFSRYHIFENTLFRHAFKNINENIESTDLNECNQLIWDTAIWNKLYKREFLQKNNIRFINDKIYYEDLLFALNASIKAESIGMVNDVLYYWRFRNTQNSVTQKFSDLKNFKDRLTILKLSDKMIKEFEVDANISNPLYLKWLNHDLILHFSKINEYPHENQSELINETAKILNFIPDDLFNELSPFKKELYSIIKSEDNDALIKYVACHNQEDCNEMGIGFKENLDLDELVFEVKDISKSESSLLIKFAEKNNSHYNYNSDNFTSRLIDASSEHNLEVSDNTIIIPLDLLINRRFLKIKINYEDTAFTHESYLTNARRKSIEFKDIFIDVGVAIRKHVQIDCFNKSNNNIIVSDIKFKNDNFILTGNIEKRVSNLNLTNVVTFEKISLPIEINEKNNFTVKIPFSAVYNHIIKKWELNCEESYNTIKASREFAFQNHNSKTVFSNQRNKILIANDAFKGRQNSKNKVNKIINRIKRKINVS